MEDINEGEEIIPKGNDWEVVALTHSAYAAAPGPNQDFMDKIQSNLVEGDSAETSQTMFMSGHFGFPLNQNENLARASEHMEKSDLDHEEHLNGKGLISDEFPVLPNYDEKGSNLFADDAFSNLVEKEQNIYNTEKFDSYDDEMSEGGMGNTEPFVSFNNDLDSSLSNVQSHVEEDKCNELPNLPCEAWWRRHAVSVYSHAKNANPLWSIFVAAAVVGLVIIGHRWQRDKQHVLRLKPQLVIYDEGTRWMLGPMSRLKDVTLGGQQGPYIRVRASTGP